MMHDVILSPDQQDALNKIGQWYRTGQSRMFRLGGPAGTGKTTLAKRAVQEMGLKPFDAATFWAQLKTGHVQAQEDTYCCAALTRRAAGVLARKGLRGARTIHSLAYNPWINLTPEIRKEIAALERAIAELETAIEQAVEKHGEDHGTVTRSIRKMFRLVARVDSLQEPDFMFTPTMIEACSILLLDESSMIPSHMWKDLLSADVRILALGDHFQLPPVEGFSS